MGDLPSSRRGSLVATDKVMAGKAGKADEVDRSAVPESVGVGLIVYFVVVKVLICKVRGDCPSIP